MRTQKECGRWTAAALSTLVMAASAGDDATHDCEYSAERRAEVPLQGITRVVIDGGAGQLKVQGSAEQSSLSAQGTACATSTRTLEEIKLHTRTDGQTAYVTAEMPTYLWNPLDWTAGQWMALHLTVRLPASMAIEVVDSSGSIEIRNVGATSVDDSSGSILVTDINGDLEIEDGSGSINIENVEGNVRLEDGSGSMLVQQVSGDVVVARDGSGSISISDVQKDVMIERDGSGSIAANNVGGSFTVESDGSGGVHHHGVKGSIRIDD